MDILRLNRSDNLGVRDFVLALYLQLGQDQQCYDFMKWYVTTGSDIHYDWGNPALPFLDVRDADPFEAIAPFGRRLADLNCLVSLTLLKYRLLRDLQSLQHSAAVAEKVPSEIMSMLRDQLVGNVVAARRDVMERNDQTKAIQRLEQQVEKLFRAVKAVNKFFWPALLEPGDMMEWDLEGYSPGSEEEVALALKSQYLAWWATPGATDMVRQKMERS